MVKALRDVYGQGLSKVKFVENKSLKDRNYEMLRESKAISSFQHETTPQREPRLAEPSSHPSRKHISEEMISRQLYDDRARGASMSKLLKTSSYSFRAAFPFDPSRLRDQAQQNQARKGFMPTFYMTVIFPGLHLVFKLPSCPDSRVISRVG